jgi:hypothetical protein
MAANAPVARMDNAVITGVFLTILPTVAGVCFCTPPDTAGCHFG